MAAVSAETKASRRQTTMAIARGRNPDRFSMDGLSGGCVNSNAMMRPKQARAPDLTHLIISGINEIWN
jgi:hypothetical protein